MKVKHKMNRLDDEKINKWKKNKNDKIDNAIIKRNCNYYQLKIFEKKISME